MDEIVARIEVARLYEGIPGQTDKAVRYYLDAAGRLRDAGLPDHARELYGKVLSLRPHHPIASHYADSVEPTGTGLCEALLRQRKPTGNRSFGQGVDIRGGYDGPGGGINRG